MNLSSYESHKESYDADKSSLLLQHKYSPVASILCRHVPIQLILPFDTWNLFSLPLPTHGSRIERAYHWSIVFHKYDMAQRAHSLDFYALNYMHIAVDLIKFMILCSHTNDLKLDKVMPL